MRTRLAAALFTTGLVATAATSMARPGTINYVEGSVTLAGQTLGARQMGQTEAAEGQVLATAHGKAEMLLTPGVLLRLGDNSAVRMISPSLTDTRVELLRGEALIEASLVRKENRIDVRDGGVDTLILKDGIYRFDARPSVAVFEGKVKVLADDRSVEFGKGKELDFAANAKPRSFDRDRTDELYAWSKLRSGYQAQASQATAQTILVGGPGWYGSGWYWSPWYRTFAYVPGDGYMFSPFGFGYYSPAYWYSYGRAYGRSYGYRSIGPSGFRATSLRAAPLSRSATVGMARGARR